MQREMIGGTLVLILEITIWRILIVNDNIKEASSIFNVQEEH